MGVQFLAALIVSAVVVLALPRPAPRRAAARASTRKPRQENR